MQLQLNHLYKHRERLQQKHGEQSLFAIHGAGCIEQPNICFVFMNPTGKNISAVKQRKGIRAPRLGTKNVWKIFFASNIISKATFEKIQSMKSDEWSEEFSEKLYKEIAAKKVYITNLAKCTQIDARPLSDKVFKEYLALTQEELAIVQPKHIITLGNQVSSILLGRPIKVSEYIFDRQKNQSACQVGRGNEVFLDARVIPTTGEAVSTNGVKKLQVSKAGRYKKNEYETLIIKGKEYKVYPTFYPVGQGTRNMPLAIQRIHTIYS